MDQDINRRCEFLRSENCQPRLTSTGGKASKAQKLPFFLICCFPNKSHAQPGLSKIRQVAMVTKHKEFIYSYTAANPTNVLPVPAYFLRLIGWRPALTESWLAPKGSRAGTSVGAPRNQKQHIELGCNNCMKGLFSGSSSTIRTLRTCLYRPDTEHRQPPLATFSFYPLISNPTSSPTKQLTTKAIIKTSNICFKS